MSTKILPRELVSLVHHIELNKTGWWEKFIEQIILATLWIVNKNLSSDEIIEEAKKNFEIELSSSKLISRLQRLCESQKIIKVSKESYKLPEALIEIFERDCEKLDEIEKLTKEKFCTLVKKYEKSLNISWDSFHEKIIYPLVQNIGAKTYLIITGKTPLNFKLVHDILQEFPKKDRPVLQNLLVDFLDPKDANVRRYVLRLLNAHFFLASNNLDKQSISKLANFGKTPPTFVIYLDTNFIFSMLELHENPLNEPVQSLLKSLSDLERTISIKLRVLSYTIKEAQAVIRGYKYSFESLHLPSNLAQAGLKMEVGGVIKQFLNFSSANGKSAAEYFDYYLNNLKVMLEDKGVEIVNQNFDDLKDRQEVIDDVVQMDEMEKTRRRGKSYNAIRHDIEIWHFINNKRPDIVESPLDAIYWIATLDYRFIIFDGQKNSDEHVKTPVCLDPIMLLQMLQFWIPRTDDFEKVMLSNVQLPFFAQEFDPSAEKVTLNILDTLSKFEDVENLSDKAVSSILLNDGLRQKIAISEDAKTKVELIKDEIIKINQKISQQIEEKDQEIKEAKIENQIEKEKQEQLSNKNKQLEMQLEKFKFCLWWGGGLFVATIIIFSLSIDTSWKITMIVPLTISWNYFFVKKAQKLGYMKDWHEILKDFFASRNIVDEKKNTLPWWLIAVLVAFAVSSLSFIGCYVYTPQILLKHQVLISLIVFVATFLVTLYFDPKRLFLRLFLLVFLTWMGITCGGIIKIHGEGSGVLFRLTQEFESPPAVFHFFMGLISFTLLIMYKLEKTEKKK